MTENKKIFRNTLITIIAAASIFAGGCSEVNTATDQGQVNTPAQVSETRTENQSGETHSIEGINFEKAVVSRVVDGDTVVLSDGKRVRFIGMDTPESTITTEFYGEEASDYTKSRLTGKTCTLKRMCRKRTGTCG